MAASTPAVSVKKEGILLQGTHHEFESHGVLNPACLQEGDNVHMYYRAVRPPNHSTIGYCRLQGPLEIVERLPHPLLVPEHAYEAQGMEDPRIVRINGTIYMNYTAYDGHNALGALCVGENHYHMRKEGIVTPLIAHDDLVRYFHCAPAPLNRKYFLHYEMYRDMGILSPHNLVWDKDVTFFPEKINGRYAMLHRIYPGIQIVYFDDLKHLRHYPWGEYFTSFAEHQVLDPHLSYESGHVGAGCPPIATEKGWLLIYHAVEETAHGKRYAAAAALLDRTDPRRVLARLPQPLIEPETPWEHIGIVNDVVFPSGTALFGDRLYIYYGAADERVAVASVSFTELLDALDRAKEGMSQ